MADDVITLITRDHRTLERLFEQVQADKGEAPAPASAACAPGGFTRP